MSNVTIASLRAQKTSLVNQSVSLAAKGVKTEEQRTAWDSVQNQISEIDSRIAGMEQVQELMSKRQSQQPTQTEQVMSKILPEVQRLIAPTSTQTADPKIAINRSMAKYLKTGKRDLTSGLGDSAGGAIVPQQFLQEFVYALKAYADLPSLVTAKLNEAQPTKFNRVDDTAHGMTLVAETASSSSTQADSTQSSTIIDTDALVTRVTYSKQFEDDAFDFQKFLNEIAAVRVSRTLEAAITNATDAAGTALPNSISGGLIGNAPSAGTLAASGAVAIGDLKTLYSSIDAAYRKAAVFMGHQSVNDYLATLTTTNGDLVFKQYDGEGRLLVLGRPFVVNASMKNLSATSGPVLSFGDLKNAFGIVLRDLQIQVVSELPGLVENNLRSAVISARFAGTQLVPNAVKTLAA